MSQMVVDTAEVEDASEEGGQQGDEGLSDDPDLRMDDELRAQFPMSFGESLSGLCAHAARPLYLR